MVDCSLFYHRGICNRPRPLRGKHSPVVAQPTLASVASEAHEISCLAPAYERSSQAKRLSNAAQLQPSLPALISSNQRATIENGT
jgi:hypothetical protein